MDQQSRGIEEVASNRVEEVASNMPNDQKKIVSKEAKLHVAIPAPSGSLDFKLSLSMNLASTQGPQGSKETQIQSTGQDAQDASLLMNLASTQGPQGSKRTLIQSTSQDAQNASQTVKREPIESILIGRRIYKMYAGEYCEGKITGYDPARKLFEILYLDNDIEEMDLDELQLWIAADEHDDKTDIRHLIKEAIAQDSESPSKKAKKSSKKIRPTYMSLNLEIPDLKNDEIPNLYGDSPK